MDKVACYLLAAVSLFHAYTHLADPLGAVEQMVGASPHKSAAALVSHCIAIIGCCHAFTGTVLLSAASMSDAAHRKCILGIFAVPFTLLIGLVQLWYPATGVAPTDFTAMPFPIVYAYLGIAVAGIALAGKSAKGKTA